ncbi:hypothetical protein GCM10010441_39840 [Kitasatospora paracochleata]
MWVAHVRWGEDTAWGWFVFDPERIRAVPEPPDEPVGGAGCWRQQRSWSDLAVAAHQVTEEDEQGGLGDEQHDLGRGGSAVGRAHEDAEADL